MAKGLSFAAYRDLLTRPHVARFVFPAVVGQFPYAMIGMAILIGVRDGYGSYTYAGLAGALTALATATFAPFTGRSIDRWGQRRVGIVLGIFWLTTQALLGAALVFHPPLWVMLVCAFVVGINVPCAGMLRGRWTVALRDDPQSMNSALSLTSVIEECMWMAGAPISTLLATLVHPVAAIAFGWICFAVGITLLLSDRTYEPPAFGSSKTKAAVTSSPGVQSTSAIPDPENAPGTVVDIADPEATAQLVTATRGVEDADVRQDSLKSEGAGHGGVSPVKVASLWTAGFLALMGVQAAYGAFQSSTGVAVVAFAKELHLQEWAGAATACFSGASMLGALLYGMREWHSSVLKRFYVFLMLLAAGCSLLVIVPNLWAAALVMFMAGLFQAPTIINVNQIIFRLTPKERFTEGMALQGSMWIIGMSAANLVLGVVIDGFGARGGFVAVVGFALIALALAVGAAKSLRAAMNNLPANER